ncbi:DEAD/DEAH box helicase family protein [Cryptosporidium serpentis]
MVKSKSRVVKRKLLYNDDVEIKILKSRIIIELPKHAENWSNPNRSDNSHNVEDLNLVKREVSNLARKTDEVNGPDLFADLPISRRTLEGLKHNFFCQMTKIQKYAIPHALAGRDILGQARTGSGKTLAYVIPILENLYRSSACPLDGLLALIITPTRELASQVFDVIREVGKFHSSLSAGCIVGGKSIDSEATRINMLNILVATPGRLIQHMEESPLWNSSNLKMLVIDEADKMLDMGFSKDIELILDYLPSSSRGRQTLLFSATLDNNLTVDFIKKSLSNEINKLERICIDQVSEIPESLQQLYILVPLEEKIDTLFNFVRTHSSCKILVFVSTCKQVRFLFHIFSALKVGCKVLELYGRQSLQKRLEICHQFHNHNQEENKLKSTKKISKLNMQNGNFKKKLNLINNGVVLFCTDIASRGLDFPYVDWVVQFDIPDSTDTYVHRIGRTARYLSKGKSLLFVIPSEKHFLDQMLSRRIGPIKQVVTNAKQMRFTLHGALQSLCAADCKVKDLAEKAFISYIKSLFILKQIDQNKLLNHLSLKLFASSMGLASAPIVKVRSGESVLSTDSTKSMTKLQKFKEKLKLKRSLKAENCKDEFSLKTLESPEAAENDIDILVFRNDNSEVNHDLDTNTKSTIDVNKALKKLRFRSDGTAKLCGLSNAAKKEVSHKFFDESDDEQLGINKVACQDSTFSDEQYFQECNLDKYSQYLKSIKSRLSSNMQVDTLRDRQRVHELHVKRRRKLRESRKGTDGDKIHHLDCDNGASCDYEEDYSENEISMNVKELALAALEKLGVNKDATGA